jgi:hypothetical protein
LREEKERGHEKVKEVEPKLDEPKLDEPKLDFS